MDNNLLTLICSIVAAGTGLFAIVYSVVKDRNQKRKSDLSIVVLSMGGGKENIAIRNNGEADAKNIKISFPNQNNIKFDKRILSNAIVSKGQQLNLYYHPIPGEKNIICVISWDDKRGHHQKEQSIQVL